MLMTLIGLGSLLILLETRGGVQVVPRTPPPPTGGQGGVIVVSAIALVFLATLVIVAAEGGRLSFLSIFFEVGSAFGTVGLSTGITGQLGAVSKLTLCGVMLVGRIGPLSLVIALSQARPPRRYEYPEENVMIG